jgi:hypothetical protein
MRCLLLAASAASFQIAPTLIHPKPLASTNSEWQQFEVDAWRDAVVAFDDDEDEDFELFLDDLDGDLEETPPPRDDAPRYLREAVEVCGADVALEGLTARERDVLEARYWSEAPRTQLDAANELDVSLTRVNNLERSARKKLERLLEERRSMEQTEAEPSDDDGLSDAAQRALAEGRLMLGVMERRVGYFYFRDELGLDEVTMSRLLAHHGAVLSQRRDTLAEKGASLRRHLNLDENELKKLIRVQPTLLGHNATQLQRKIEWLRAACELEHARELGQACLRCPPLLATSARRVLAPAITQLRALDPSGALARRILEQHPNALRARDVGARLKALADAVDGDAQDAARMAWKEPRALAIDARSLEERAAALRRALGEREANALIGKRPDVLLASTSKLSDVAAALELSLGLTRANATRLAARVASTAPRVVASTASAKVHQRATFLCKELGLSPERAAAVVYRRPQCLGLSVEKNLRPACAWLASELLGGSEKVASLQEIDADKLDALRNLVDAYPTVLGLSVEKNLKPKLHALRTELKPSELRDRGKHPLARDGAAAAVLQCPALLGYSLDGRLRPRLRRIRQAGLPLADIATLAQCPEAQFEKRLQGRLARA